MNDIFVEPSPNPLPKGWRFAVILKGDQGLVSVDVPSQPGNTDLLSGASLLLEDGLKINITAWSRFLMNVASTMLSEAAPRSIAVDLGAGPFCVVTRALQERFPHIDFAVVEPNIDPLISSEIRSFQSILEVDDNSVDYIFFNPPASPTAWIDPKADNWFIFDGGPNGHDVISNVLEQAKTKIKKDGSILVLVPSYLPFSSPQGTSFEVMDTRRSELSELVERAPYVDRTVAREKLNQMILGNARFWLELGVPCWPNSYQLSAIRIQRDN